MKLDSGPSARIKKATGAVATVIAHIGIIYALLFSLSHAQMVTEKLPIEVKIIREKKLPPPPLPHAGAPKLKAAEIPVIPLPEITTTEPPAVLGVRSAQHDPEPLQVASPPPLIASDDAPEGDGVRHPWLNVNRCDLPAYPWMSQRDHEEGTVTIAFLIDENGSVVESKISKTSGFPDLDEAARSGLSKCKFMPGTLNGVPRQSWKKIRFVWELPY